MRDIAGVVSVDVLFQHIRWKSMDETTSEFMRLSRAMSCARSSYVCCALRRRRRRRPWKWTVARPQGDAVAVGLDASFGAKACLTTEFTDCTGTATGTTSVLRLPPRL